MLPTFLGIGAPKAGTTWLANALADHPEVCMSSPKEPDYFSHKYDNHPGDAASFYAPLFGDAANCKAVGEFSTSYLAWKSAPERVASVIPDARLIVVFRDPVSQIYSHYWHLQRQNFHVRNPAAAETSFEDALVRFEKRLVRPARYAEHLDRWLAHFGREQFLFLLFEDLKRSPQDVLRATYAHIGVDPSWQPATVEDTGSGARQGTSPRSGRAARWGAHAYRFLDWKVYRPLKKAIGGERASAIKDALRVRSLFETAFRQKGYPPMPDDVRLRLQEMFREPNRDLAERIGQPLDHWGSPRR